MKDIDTDDERVKMIARYTTPYRLAAPTMTYKEPRDFGPIKRCGKLAIVVAPVLIPLAFIPLIGISVIPIILIYCILSIIFGALIVMIGHCDSDIEFVMASAWWPIYLPYKLFKYIGVSFSKLIHYIKTGE